MMGAKMRPRICRKGVLVKWHRAVLRHGPIGEIGRVSTPARIESHRPLPSDLAADMDDIYCFGGNPLDRASERRNDRAWIAELRPPELETWP